MQINHQESVHARVLESLRDVTLLGGGYKIKIEKRHGRLDLPRDLNASVKDPMQRRKNLMYVDAVVSDVNTANPRILVEIVHTSPASPNGIVGLVINADRVAGLFPGLDLVFVVLGEMKCYWCFMCKAGHEVTSDRHFVASWTTCKDVAPEDILHEGTPANFRKGLSDYKIKPYLKHTRPPSVLFLNAYLIENAWAEYRPIAREAITTHLYRRIRSTDREGVPFDRVEELFPGALRQKLGLATVHADSATDGSEALCRH